ncbi:hypothetical protein WICPIJ_008159 [Wickerhamomyces pijperi]|uniref:Uncharacterized protein n=1 Tax=Wickerhamomyces pijperi TaxID=599730 RepID=A0A9P8PZZ3_WICPI|nr:hypothetical protein WICPIJ_008159 [Wickerhamomyces pijperi]
MCLSNLPGLIKAWSKTSGLLVPAKTTIWSEDWKPSISTNNWFNVVSLSSLAPEKFPLVLALPMASISSMNTIAGAFSRAVLNKSRTREAPTPTNISTNSEPETV